jgi:predicted homoserine dehydrogenase-like protein
MGTDIVVQVALMAGLRIEAIADFNPEVAIDAGLLAGCDRGDVVPAQAVRAIDSVIKAGIVAVTDDLSVIAWT